MSIPPDYSPMNPENLSAEALRIFNNLPTELQSEAMQLCLSHSEEASSGAPATR